VFGTKIANIMRSHRRYSRVLANFSQFLSGSLLQRKKRREKPENIEGTASGKN